MTELHEQIKPLYELMRLTLERWALNSVHESAFRNPILLANALLDEYLIDHDTHDALLDLHQHTQLHKDTTSPADQVLQTRAQSDELLDLFTQLANEPTLGKRHNVIIPAWLAGESLAELAESRGVDEQRILVLLHEVVRYYEVASLEELREVLVV